MAAFPLAGLGIFSSVSLEDGTGRLTQLSGTTREVLGVPDTAGGSWETAAALQWTEAGDGTNGSLGPVWFPTSVVAFLDGC